MLKSALLAKLNSKKLNKKTSLKNLKKDTKIKSIKRPKSECFNEETLILGEKFHIDPKIVAAGVEGLIKFRLENPQLQNNLFDEEFPIFLQINSIKVPPGFSKIARIPLKHSLLTAESEVCLIVADVKGVPNKNHDTHKEHYEKLLRQKGVNNIKQIMTFHEFRTEYETFEMKSRLVELYDHFLVDGRIGGKTVRKCGKIFYKKRKVPTSIKMSVTKLKDHIDQTLNKTALYLHSKGDSFNVQIGHSKMNLVELVDNVLSVVSGLDKQFPGGFGNIRSLNLFAFRGLSIPIYTTLKKKKEVDLQKVKNEAGEFKML